MSPQRVWSALRGIPVSVWFPSTTRCEENVVDVAPDLSRHGPHALIRKYLTPDVYQALAPLQTVNGVRLEDIIRAGITLPWGADPPRGIAGIYAGDADSYQVFAPLLDPLIEDYHRAGVRKRGLQRHRTNLNPQSLLQQELDPEGHYILSTRMRLARSLEGYRFAPCLTRTERRRIAAILEECTSSWPGKYRWIKDMSNDEHDDLIQRAVLFPDPDDFALAAGTHRDWPDGRAIYYHPKESPELIVWVNNEDHIWIISYAKGGDVQGVFARLSRAAWSLESELAVRGHAFVEDRRLGFLNASPANIGPALRASVYVKLVHLGKQPGFGALIHKLRLDARAQYDEPSGKGYTGIFHIANAEALGKSEVDLINIMIVGVAGLIDIEKRLAQGEEIDLDSIVV